MTPPFIKKDSYDRAAHRAAAEAGYADLRGYVEANPAPHAIPIKHDIFVHCKDIAEKESVTPAVVINEALRQWLGER